MIIDAHQHIVGDEESYMDRLAEEAYVLGIDKMCLLGLSPQFKGATNDRVHRALKKYPDLFIGFAYLDLKNDTPDSIDRFLDKGFKGLKLIDPPSAYHKKEFFAFYQRAEKLEMPVLFHSGIRLRLPDDHLFDIDCNRMRPVYLDTIARAFPNLTLIGAHFGDPWYREAARACWWNPNLYFDLSGTTLTKNTPEYLGKLFWWNSQMDYGKRVWEKIVLGTDCHYDHIHNTMEKYETIMNTLEIPPDIQKNVMGNTMAHILGL